MSWLRKDSSERHASHAGEHRRRLQLDVLRWILIRHAIAPSLKSLQMPAMPKNSHKPATRDRLPGGLSGVAGEYFVAAELSRRGYIATLTLRNARGIDIIVADSDSTRSVGIQVKTSQSPGAAWLASKKVEEATVANNLFFVFVNLISVAACST